MGGEGDAGEVLDVLVGGVDYFGDWEKGGVWEEWEGVWRSTTGEGSGEEGKEKRRERETTTRGNTTRWRA